MIQTQCCINDLFYSSQSEKSTPHLPNHCRPISAACVSNAAAAAAAADADAAQHAPQSQILAKVSSLSPCPSPCQWMLSLEVAPSQFPSLIDSLPSLTPSLAPTRCCASFSVPDEQAEGCCTCIQHFLYGADARSVIAFDDFSEHGVGGASPSSDGSARGNKSSKEKSSKPAILRSQSSPDTSDVRREPPGGKQAATVPQTGALEASPGNLSPLMQKHFGVSFDQQGLGQAPARSISTPVLGKPKSPTMAV